MLWLSRDWALVHDAPIMHYIAWRIGEGAVPYRDLFDMNFPGVYLLHMALLGTLGGGDVAWRVFDLGALALTGLLIAALAAPWGVVAATGGALFFVLHHVASGAWQAGQRDFLLCPFLLAGALGVARWSERPEAGARAVRAVVPLTLAGLALGAGLTIKPQAAVLVLALGAVIAVRAHGGRAWPLAAFAFGVVIPLVAVAGWVAALGGLASWRAILIEYLLPLYSRVGRPSSWAFHRWHVWIAIAVAVLVSLGHGFLSRRFTVRHVVVTLGIAYGVVHFVGQGKGWEYHLYPLAAFSAVVLFAALEPVRLVRPLGVGLAACLAVVALLLAIKGAEASHPAWLSFKERRVAAVVHTLEGRLDAGDTVQVLDTTAGGIHALLRLGVSEPTRFVYDFHFFHDVDHPTIRGLRRQFADALATHPPRFVLLFEEGWPGGGYERVASFPALAAILATYTVETSGEGYRVLARPSTTAPRAAAR